MFGKQPNPKLKTVTIMHSSTTETVRLPPEGGDSGQVTVHPAVRSKLPLKQKVRNGKKRRPTHRPKDASSSANSSPKKINTNTYTKNQRGQKKFDKRKRPSRENDKKVKNKVPTKVKKKKKETIDYSAAQKESKTILTSDIEGVPTTPDNETDPVGKVQNWLLKSQLPVVIPKSKSTPVGLTHSSPVKAKPALRPTTNGDKSRSVGHLPDKEKMRLQVIYKPPFKFSVKLRKADKSSVVVDRSGQRVADRSGPNLRPTAANNSSARAGLLVRSVKERNNHRRHRSASEKPINSLNSPPILSDVMTGVSQPVEGKKPAAGGSPNTGNELADSNIHTVQSDLEVLLSESEFLFSDG